MDLVFDILGIIGLIWILIFLVLLLNAEKILEYFFRKETARLPVAKERVLWVSEKRIPKLRRKPTDGTRMRLGGRGETLLSKPQAILSSGRFVFLNKRTILHNPPPINFDSLAHLIDVHYGDK